MKHSPTKFCCTGYIALSPTGSGVFYPIFGAPNANASFVQEVAQDGTIYSFIPFYDHDAFKFFPTHNKPIRVLGDDSIYAFLDANGDMQELDYSAIGRLVRLNDKILDDKKLPILTRLSLSRLGGASQSQQLELLRTFSSSVLRSPSSARVVESAHKKFAFESEMYWEQLDIGAGDGRPSKSTNEFLDFGTEELFEWLFQHPCDESWTRALRTLMRRVVYDERMFDLIGSLVSMDGFSLRSATKSEKAIVARGVELYSKLNNSAADFAEAMYEFVQSGDIILLDTIVPIKVIFTFIDQLESAEKIDFLPIDIYLDQLNSDVISRDLAYSLIEEIKKSDAIRLPYPEKSLYAGFRRLEIFKNIVAKSGRIGLVVDLKDRRQVEKIPVNENRE